jgi:exopolysaccharide biosynthesis polyprenyl glycosylphosphotransferase
MSQTVQPTVRQRRPIPLPGTGPAEFRRRRAFLGRAAVALDVAAFALAFALADFVYWLFRPAHNIVNRSNVTAVLVLSAVAIVTMVFERARSAQPLPSLIAFKSIGTAAAAVYALLFFYRPIGFEVSRPGILAFAFISACLVSLTQSLARKRLAGVQSRVLHGIALVGARAACEEVGPRLSNSPSWVLRAVLAFDEGESPESVTRRLQDLIRSEVVDEVMFAGDVHSGGDLAKLWGDVVTLCQLTGTKLRLHTPWPSGLRHVYLDHLDERPVLTFGFGPELDWGLTFKRFTDIVGSVFLLVLTGPLLLVAAIAIRLESPGPIIFKQTRCGLRGRRFTLYKLRSMVIHAEAMRHHLQQANEMTGPVFKLRSDPRITAVGRWLRRASIDELPQLLNVLKGDMSLVGPRPPLPSEVDDYALGDLRRLAMKPGITGLWQVSGRNTIRDFSRWVELDAAYIRNWSIFLDIHIMIRTAWAVIRLTGR